MMLILAVVSLKTESIHFFFLNGDNPSISVIIFSSGVNLCGWNCAKRLAYSDVYPFSLTKSVPDTGNKNRCLKPKEEIFQLNHFAATWVRVASLCPISVSTISVCLLLERWHWFCEDRWPLTDIIQNSYRWMRDLVQPAYVALPSYNASHLYLSLKIEIICLYNSWPQILIILTDCLCKNLDLLLPVWYPF